MKFTITNSMLIQKRNFKEYWYSMKRLFIFQKTIYLQLAPVRTENTNLPKGLETYFN